MQSIDLMKTPEYKENVLRQIEQEKERNQSLLNRAGQLEKQIKVLIDDSVDLLKARMSELGISTTSHNDLLCKAKEIVGRHKELQALAAKLQQQVNHAEQEQQRLVKINLQNIADMQHDIKNGGGVGGQNGMNMMMMSSASATALMDAGSLINDMTPATSHELVLKEIANTLTHRKKLHAQVKT